LVKRGAGKEKENRMRNWAWQRTLYSGSDQLSKRCWLPDVGTGHKSEDGINKKGMKRGMQY